MATFSAAHSSLTLALQPMGPAPVWTLHPPTSIHSPVVHTERRSWRVRRTHCHSHVFQPLPLTFEPVQPPRTIQARLDVS